MMQRAPGWKPAGMKLQSARLIVLDHRFDLQLEGWCFLCRFAWCCEL